MNGAGNVMTFDEKMQMLQIALESIKSPIFPTPEGEE